MSSRKPPQRTPVLTAKERREQKEIPVDRKIEARILSFIIGLVSWMSLFVLVWLMLCDRERWCDWQTWLVFIFFFFVGLFSLPTRGIKKDDHDRS